MVTVLKLSFWIGELPRWVYPVLSKWVETFAGYVYDWRATEETR